MGRLDLPTLCAKASDSCKHFNGEEHGKDLGDAGGSRAVMVHHGGKFIDGWVDCSKCSSMRCLSSIHEVVTTRSLKTNERQKTNPWDE